MLCNYGYDVERCFDCPYGNSPHIPEGYEGWSNTVIKDTLVTKRRTHVYLRDHTAVSHMLKLACFNWPELLSQDKLTTTFTVYEPQLRHSLVGEVAIVPKPPVIMTVAILFFWS